MDKINTANWSNYFRDAEQTILHLSERYAETEMRFAEYGLASGSIKAVATPGMMLTELNITVEKPFMLNDKEGKEEAESLFVLKGNVESRFPNVKTPLHFGRQNHSIQYNTNFEGNHLIHSDCFHALTITYNPAYLSSILQSAGAGALDKIGKSIERKENFLATPYSLAWHNRIAEVIHNIQTCSFQGLTRYIFIESKMMELFVLQMEHLHSVQTAPLQEKWSAADREKLLAVKEYIEQNFLEPVTLQEFCYKFGLNEFKLKKGYKHFFQTTVFGHIHHLRMQKAKALLQKRQMNVSEAAYYIGYNNIGSFSAEFKKRFGYIPSQLYKI